MPYKLLAKPVVHEARQWSGENLDEMIEFCRWQEGTTEDGRKLSTELSRAALRNGHLFVLIEDTGMVHIPVGEVVVRTETDTLRNFTSEEFTAKYAEVL